MARGKAERLTVKRDDVEVTALRVHAECLLSEHDVEALKAFAKGRGETYHAFTARMLQSAIDAAMEEARAAAAVRAEERERAQASIAAMEEALRRDQQRLKETQEKLAAARRAAGGGQFHAAHEETLLARWQ